MNRRFSLPDVHATRARVRREPSLSREKFVLLLYIQMCYEWDEGKNRLNQEKHGISFEIAALAFEDERCLVRPDRIDERGEQRWQAIGAARIEPGAAVIFAGCSRLQGGNRWRRNHPHYLGPQG